MFGQADVEKRQLRRVTGCIEEAKQTAATTIHVHIVNSIQNQHGKAGS